MLCRLVALPVSSLKVNVRRIGQRLDEETQLAVRAIIQAQQRTEQDKSRKAQLRVGSSSSP
jgi:hypothetical protein